MGRSDEELLAASRRGEREAFGALVERYQGVVCAVSYSRTGDRTLSEDVAQDTFLAAWRQLDQLREVGRLRSWLCGIACNLAKKARKRTSRETSELPTTIAQDNPFDQLADVQADALVRDALTRVPETYRDVLVLYYREQRSMRDVARLLDISEAAALQRLSRGRQYLTDGVSALVESSLRGHVQKSLVAGVLAAILIPSSHASASTNAKGTSMIKFALVGAALIAAGTTAVATKPWTHRDAQQPPTLAVSAPTGAPALHAAREPTLRALPTPKPNAVAEPELPELGAAQLAHAKVLAGPTKGAADAPVTITVYTDLLCPYCSQALGTIDQLQDEYPGKIRIVMKAMPVHTASMLPAEADYAADAQNKFWELHTLMEQHPDDLSRPVVEALAQQAGLEMPAFRAALDDHAFKPTVDADLAAAKELEINGAPGFVINGRRITGLHPIGDFRAAVDDALAQPAG